MRKKRNFGQKRSNFLFILLFRVHFIDYYPVCTKNKFSDSNASPKHKKLWVGCAASFPPYEIRDERGFSGIDIELCAAIAKKLI
ncbi:MAG: hypothetical protein IJ859_02475 [Synergistaceae bacterium]|nr:hypothetical protein [Synergistaceae bacterium]